MGRKRRVGRGRGNAPLRPALSMSQAFERSLSVRKDKAIFKGSFLYSVSASGVNTLGFNPTNFGTRGASLVLLYSRFRILKVVVKVIPPTGTSVSGITFGMGILDDTGSSVDAPTSLSSIMQCRTSLLFGDSLSVPQEFQWNPIDPNLWYHTDSEGSGGDSRWQYPAVLYTWNGSSTNVVAQVFFTVEFEGASISA